MDFTYDDGTVVLDDPRIWQGDIGALWIRNEQLIWAHQVRTLSYMLDFALFGFAPKGYHLHNLFWHALCVVLVFVLIKKLTHHPTFSFLGGLIFSVHPVHVEAVTNITNRKELLALGFLLIAFLSYLQFLEGKTGRKWAWLLAATGSWGLGLLSKQVTIMFPLLLVVYEYLMVPPKNRFLTKNTVLLLVLVSLGSLVLFLYALFIMDITNLKTSKFLSSGLKGYGGDLTYISLLSTSALVFWDYIQLLVWPVGLCPDHVVDLSPSFLDIRVLVAWSGLIGFIVIVLRVFRKWPVLAFGMLWFLISFVPISNWVPSSYILADRYMYMPSVGYCIVFVALSQAFYRWLLHSYPRRAIVIAALLAAAVTVGYTSTTLAHNSHWSNPETLWNATLQCNPDSTQAFNGLGNFYFEQGMYGKAREYLSRAIEQGYIKAYNNRGNVFYEMGEYQAALKDYNIIISLKPDWGKPYSNRGILYLAQKQYDRAVLDFTKALERSRQQSRVFNLRGLAYEESGQLTKAEDDYRQAISSDPFNAEAFFNLGRVQLHNNELNAAILSYQKAKDLGWTKAEDVLKVLRKKGYLK